MLVILSALLCAASAEVQKLEPVGLLGLVLSKRTEQRKRMDIMMGESGATARPPFSAPDPEVLGLGLPS